MKKSDIKDIYIIENYLFAYYCLKFGDVNYLNEFLYMSFDHKCLFEKIYNLDSCDIDMINRMVDILHNIKNKNISNFKKQDIENKSSDDFLNTINTDGLSCFA